MKKKYSIKKAEHFFGKFLQSIGFDFENDPHMKDTPKRVVKAYIEDLFKGCYTDEPSITGFPNLDKYDGMVFEGDIPVKSMCSHHLLPFVGKAYVAYIPSANGKMIGLSKLNRIVEWFSRRPQVQENLTMQISNYIDKVCEDNLGVAVMIEAKHNCTCLRGVGHDSIMKTSKLTGAFLTSSEVRDEFYFFVKK